MIIVKMLKNHQALKIGESYGVSQLNADKLIGEGKAELLAKPKTKKKTKADK